MKSQILVLLCIVVVSFSAHAQTTYSSPETGEHPLGTYFKTDIDSVSLTNGNLHLHIPLFSLPGRELPVTVAMDYDSQFFELRYLPGPEQTPAGYESLQWRKSGGVMSGKVTASSFLLNDIASSPTAYTFHWQANFVFAAPGGRRFNF